jgi:hypothetical protein
MIVPESPRWLVNKGRPEKALEVLSKLHHDNEGNNAFARRELDLIREQIEADKLSWARDGRWQLFTLKTYRKRFILAFILLMGGQNVGVLVINNYNVLIYQSLGLEGASSLAVAAGWNTVAMLGNFAGSYFSDKIGRRRSLGESISHIQVSYRY